MTITRWVYHPLTFILFVVGATLMAVSLQKSFRDDSLASQTLARQQAERDALKQETRRLEAQITQANQPLALEKIIRDETLRLKPGEQVFVLPEITVTAPTPPPPPTPTPNWQQWRDVLFYWWSVDEQLASVGGVSPRSRHSLSWLPLNLNQLHNHLIVVKRIGHAI